MATSSSARNTLPKRLEEELAALDAPRYKAALPPPTIRSVLNDSVERALYDQILGPLISRPRSSQQSRPSSSSSSSSSLAAPASSSSSSSDSFTTSLLSRLSLVEGDNKDLRRQMAERVLRIEQLEKENRMLKRQVDAAASSARTKELLEELEEARGHGADLEAQIEEMEQFLSDYGLVWVGNQQQEQQKQQGQQQQQRLPLSPSPSASAVEGHGVNFHDFATKVAELNRIISSEPAQIKVDVERRKARLQHATEAVEHIPVTFYRNGLMIKRGPFREHSAPSCVAFVRDIMDGYFPSEFRREYPDGVVLELKDRHNEDYSSSSAGAAADRMSGSQLLRRLPQSVIRNGEVVTIRDEVDRLLTSAPSSSSSSSSFSSSSSLSSTAGAGAGAVGGGKAGGVVILATPAASASPSHITFVTVQVRWIDGSLLQAKMFPDDLVGDLRQHILRHCTASSADALVTSGGIGGEGEGAGAGAAAFELRAAYPPRRLEDSMTLAEAGLTPSGVVHARRI